MDGFKSAQRLRDCIEASSWRSFRLGLALYSTYVGRSPDDLIADRRATFRSDDLEVARGHERLYLGFMTYLGSLNTTTKPRHPLYPNTVKTRLGASAPSIVETMSLSWNQTNTRRSIRSPSTRPLQKNWSASSIPWKTPWEEPRFVRQPKAASGARTCLPSVGITSRILGARSGSRSTRELWLMEREGTCPHQRSEG